MRIALHEALVQPGGGQALTLYCGSPVPRRASSRHPHPAHPQPRHTEKGTFVAGPSADVVAAQIRS
ncbi:MULTISPECIES: hypothetical protein [unclassified Streptomyces]|uniref:hypothetical protein n=1 Tax=unclassified Streptomyces TaxID=2593676 RepID=UPI0033EF1654